MSSRVALSLALVVAFDLVSVQGQETPAGSPQTFRSSVDLVTVHATVRDKRGRVVSGLTPADFEIRDNGERRPILSLRSDRQSPISLAILIDTSGSMRVGGKIEMAQQAYASILSQLRQDHDEVGLFTFDIALHERRGFTRDVAGLKDALADLGSFGMTSLYDATAATARQLASRSATNKAIIVITDGTDTSSEMTARDVSGLAGSIDVPVYVVATVPSIDERQLMETSARPASGDADLRDLADWTGGQFVFASTFGETAVAASGLIAELRQQYVLAIEATAQREWRRLEVRVTRPAAVVKSRSGYYGG